MHTLIGFVQIFISYNSHLDDSLFLKWTFVQFHRFICSSTSMTMCFLKNEQAHCLNSIVSQVIKIILRSLFLFPQFFRQFSLLLQYIHIFESPFLLPLNIFSDTRMKFISENITHILNFKRIKYNIEVIHWMLVKYIFYLSSRCL